MEDRPKRKGVGGFQLLENGSNFPLFSHDEDGKLTFDRRSTQLGQRDLGCVGGGGDP